MSTDYGIRRDDLILLLEKYQIGKRSTTSEAVLADYLLNCLDAFESALWARKHLPRQDGQ